MFRYFLHFRFLRYSRYFRVVSIPWQYRPALKTTVCSATSHKKIFFHNEPVVGRMVFKLKVPRVICEQFFYQINIHRVELTTYYNRDTQHLNVVVSINTFSLCNHQGEPLFYRLLSFSTWENLLFSPPYYWMQLLQLQTNIITTVLPFKFKLILKVLFDYLLRSMVL